jgi:hypothetical protein
VFDPARRRFATYDIFGEPSASSRAPMLGLSHAAENDALARLMDLRRRAMERHRHGAQLSAEDALALEQDTRALTVARRTTATC